MRYSALRIVVPFILLAIGGCESSGSSSTFRSPSAPSPTPTPPTAGPPPGPPALVSFRETESGFSTTDLRDVEEQILQLNTAGELIWAADGTRLPGYRAMSHTFSGGTWHFIEGAICSEGCAFEVRFGSHDGERRAYLTVDYGHDNPGTVVDVEVHDGRLIVLQTNVFPPGTFTLSGVVTEMTPSGPVPVEGAQVYRAIVGGWQGSMTDKDGFFAIRGLFNSSRSVETSKSGYITDKRAVIVDGDTRLDVTLVPQP
jgi:hypothetical protein